MLLKISDKNTKIGAIPNLSMTPGRSCVPGVPCLTEGCYALGSYKRFKNVKTAWDSNLRLYNEEPDVFFTDLRDWLRVHEPERFRLFVGGDMPDESFWYFLVSVMQMFPKTKFLLFTKRYDYNYSIKPYNCQVILSIWPNWPLPNNKSLPWAWLKEDSRFPADDLYLKCPGGCEDCNHKCWDFVCIEVPVVFEKHR